ncbi:hypothetical protein EMIHUDRAFT_257621 [Emiliania huxleyi CCMP1516]|uniref:Uncharacterized protein n=2 Tax=Emiliania huxleyi TaxID=2903 RepID=A0A0D3IHQ4_EMIH1|nr:hypothetical protein EMIHUDRAFT_257621 [Emiliania huxleyi CCMP1516]EOD10789.1 hypothetical protein EMIHUDRAFT_257621 [Emiliania huxleyi CCMP1516]|eukprot:XP_005763218.1 hypothetical protein EMIHUDRAFT_257621 [Emiliania huxleyi CCMP1516]
MDDGSARRIRVAVVVAASSAGHSGAASATWEHVHRHFAVAALFVAQNAADPSGGPKIDSHVDFDATGAWRHHVSMRPSSRNQSAATTALTAGIGELFIVKRLREIPQWLPRTRAPASLRDYELHQLGSNQRPKRPRPERWTN